MFAELNKRCHLPRDIFASLHLSIPSNRVHVNLIADVEMKPTSSTDWIVELKPL